MDLLVARSSRLHWEFIWRGFGGRIIKCNFTPTISYAPSKSAIGTQFRTPLLPTMAAIGGDNRERLLERVREVLRFTRNMRIQPIASNTSVGGKRGSWNARIKIEGDDSDVMAEIKQRINSLTAPFELLWCRQSAKPWDWKLVRVSNRELQIPRGD